MDKVKSKLLRIFTVIASMFLVIAPAFMSNNTDAIEAADVTSSLVDSITTNIGYAKPGQKVTFHLHFSGKTDYPVKAGDTIHVNFPQASSTGAGIQGIPHEQPLIYHNPDNPNDPDNGVDMGTVTVTKTGVTITFNQKAAGLKTIEGGDFSFTGVVTKQQGTNPTQVNPWPDGGNLPTPEIGVGQNIPPATPGKGIGTPNIVMPTGQIKKSGNIGNDGNVQWQIHGVIGNPGTTTITDQAQDGQTIVPGTFKITFFGQLANSEWMSTNLQYGDDGKLPAVSEIGSLNESSNGFTLDINDANVISELEDIAQLGGDSSGLTNGNLKKVAYTITYETKLASNETHTQWTNSAVQKNPDGSSTNTANGVVANTWSNDIWGTQPKDGVIFDKQTTDGEGLPGATFQLTGNGQNQTAVSNGAGIVKFTGLTNGDTYTVKEIKAPAGYKINNETITVKIVDNKPQITINGKETNQNVIVDKSTQSSSSSMNSKKSSKKASSKKALNKKSSKKVSSKKASSKKSSMIKSSSKKASSKKASSKKSSIKSSVKSSSKKASSKKSSMIKSSSKKASSKKALSK
ncbi:prealbumin-like fold domain-containing protein, partial [Ligilactobacillus aviarius]|uniref:prealbumin-like fold domain-containing protein n=1 Tax=Ligilactobacillus aviarius TaxID=1606 RepID=UPI00249EEC92